MRRYIAKIHKLNTIYLTSFSNDDEQASQNYLLSDYFINVIDLYFLTTKTNNKFMQPKFRLLFKNYFTWIFEILIFSLTTKIFCVGVNFFVQEI